MDFAFRKILSIWLIAYFLPYLDLKILVVTSSVIWNASFCIWECRVPSLPVLEITCSECAVTMNGACRI